MLVNMEEQVLPEKGLLEKATTIKWFYYSPLVRHCKKQYQASEKIYEFDKKDYSKNLADKTKSKKQQTWIMTVDLISANIGTIKHSMVFLFLQNWITWKNFMINWNNEKYKV